MQEEEKTVNTLPTFEEPKNEEERQAKINELLEARPDINSEFGKAQAIKIRRLLRRYKKGMTNRRIGYSKPTLESRAIKYSVKKKQQRLARKKNR